MNVLVIVFGIIVLAVTAISYFKINVFMALFGASIALGFCAGFDGGTIVNTIKLGFGHTMEKIGLLIIFGVILGDLLEKSGAIAVISTQILSWLGQGKSLFAILLIGFLIGLPIFCDSGFIILSGLIFRLAKTESKIALVLCLSGSLYAVHCLVPPHPGISAGNSAFELDLGTTMLYGVLLAMPASFVAYLWAKFNRKEDFILESGDSKNQNSISFHKALVPLLMPIVLMATKAFLSILKINVAFIAFIGEPIMALCLGVFLALGLFKNQISGTFNELCTAGFKTSGHILAIIAAGGMFGEIVKKVLESYDFSQINLGHSVVWIPFLVAVFFKTAQGSSTVAVISASALLVPMLSKLGIDTETEKHLALFAIGAGSMMVSHANDAYFWVVTNFSKMDARQSFKTYTVMSVLMGLTTQMVLWIVSLVLV